MRHSQYIFFLPLKIADLVIEKILICPFLAYTSKTRTSKGSQSIFIRTKLLTILVIMY